MELKIINLTPHDVRYFGQSDTPILTITKSNRLFRVDTEVRGLTRVPYFGIDITVEDIAYVPGEMTLPKPKAEVLYIVSSLVMLMYPHRSDLIVPDDFVRAEDGTIYGCRKFNRLSSFSAQTESFEL